MAENKRGVPKDRIKILGISASPRKEKSQTFDKKILRFAQDDKNGVFQHTGRWDSY